MESYKESHVEASVSASAPVDMTGHLHENEALSRFVAYAGSYLLWGTLAIIAAAVVILP